MGIVRKSLTRTKIAANCNELTLWAYLEIAVTEDLGHLVQRGRRPAEKILIDAMEAIEAEFSALRGEGQGDNEMRDDLILYQQELIEQVYIVSALLERLCSRVQMNAIAPQTFEGLLAELERWDFPVDREAKLIDEIERISAEVRALNETIAALNERLYPKQQKSASQGQKKRLGFYRMILVYERILRKNHINLHKTTLYQFAAMETEVKEIVKQSTKNIPQDGAVK
jgi:hypothetical protein